MKNILFYSDNFCGDRCKGGLEVATYRIAKGLKDSGQWEVFNAFRHNWDSESTSLYSKIIRLSGSKRKFEKELEQFIIENEIDVVVNMTRFFRHSSMYEAAKKSGRNVKVIFMQHFAPGSEFKKLTFKAGWHLLKLNPYNPKYWIRATIYPLIKLPRKLKYKKVYGSTYNQSDRVVLLSESYRNEYAKIGRIDDFSKFVAIPNIFETEEMASDAVNTKKKRVLILSRMDEVQKRISLALKIWQKIEADPSLGDWTLDIVGTGHNSDIVKRMIKSLKLRNVVFHGWQDRDRFLQQSAILMSTSDYEGLPLSILEAQAYGVVPIAFDSYSSLRDVVTDNVNGTIVDGFGDIDLFYKSLAELMRNEQKRTQLAHNALKNSSRFHSDKITDRWLKMLQNL